MEKVKDLICETSHAKFDEWIGSGTDEEFQLRERAIGFEEEYFIGMTLEDYAMN